MHRQHMDDALIHAAGDGRSVGVFAENLGEAEEIHRQMVAGFPVPDFMGASVSKVHGRRSIRFPHGGVITFHTLRSLPAVRGVRLDVVFVPLGTAPETLADILPSLATSKLGLVTGY